MSMKKACAVLAMVLTVCFLASASLAETVKFKGVTVDKNTEYVDMGKRDIMDWDGFLAFLAQLPNLKKVDMYSTVVSLQNYRKLNELFPNVEFGCRFRYGQHKARTDDTAFSTLWAGGQKKHTYEEISMLRWCKNLYALDVGHHPIEKLDFLYDLPELRVLIVAICDVTDLTPIASLKHLEYLEIFHNHVTDLTPLSNLPYLMDLNLVKNNVSDLSPLKKNTRLKRLWIWSCNLDDPEAPTEEAVADLQAALPDCHIDYTHSSTAGGWRSHPHYDVIFRMFRKHTYEPFDDSEPENMPEPWRSERLKEKENP